MFDFDHVRKSGLTVAKTLLSSTIIAGVIVATNVANAQLTVSFTSNTASHSTEFIPATDKLTFSKFDGALGILQSVSLSVNGSITTSIHVANSAATASTGTVRTESIGTITDPNSLLSISPDIITPSRAYSLAPGTSADFTNITGSASDTGASPYSQANILAEFTGPNGTPGNISLGLGTFTSTLLSNTGGNTSASQVTTGTFTASVIYTYGVRSGVPEPNMMMMMGAGTIGAVIFASRRRRVRK